MRIGTQIAICGTVRPARRWPFLTCLIALAAPLLLMHGAAAQQRQFAPPPAAEAAPPVSPSVPAAEPRGGMLETIGRWFQQSTAGFRSHLSSAKSRFDDLNETATATSKTIGSAAIEASKNAAGVTKDAVGTVAKLPLTRIVNGRERCMLAPNGAPDCVTAAAELCRKHGFSTGTSLDFTSAEQCTPQAMLAGRQTEAECTTVTFISRAMCQ